MNPEQYVKYQILMYPSLYGCSSLEESKFRVFDQLFNTVGNGISPKTFKKIVEDDLVLSEQDIEKLKEYTSTDDFAYGYTKDEIMILNGMKLPKLYGSNESSFIVRQCDIDKHPHIVHWVPFSNNHRFLMYPNFYKEYSLCWKHEYVKHLNKKWIEVLIWYYEKCLHLFNTSENIAEHYPSAYPCKTEKDTQIHLNDFIKMIKEYPDNEAISKAYELEYYGDPDEFLRRRWKLEKERTIAFIKETLEMIRNNLK